MAVEEDEDSLGILFTAVSSTSLSKSTASSGAAIASKSLPRDGLGEAGFDSSILAGRGASAIDDMLGDALD
jgi:hypothetical protein